MPLSDGLKMHIALRIYLSLHWSVVPMKSLSITVFNDRRKLNVEAMNEDAAVGIAALIREVI